MVARYDRIQRGDGWLRVHQEDMCQAMGLWPGRKYESQGGPGAAMVADLVNRVSERPELDCQRLAQALVFNWLTCGTDAHARNYSLLHSGQSARLAPLDDLNSHLAYSDGMGNHRSMSTAGTFRAEHLTRDHWLRYSGTLHVDRRWLAAEIERQVALIPSAFRSAADGADISRHNSPAVDRLLETLGHWLQRLGVA